MQVVAPAVEIITELDPLKRIELAGRVCYKSEDKIHEGSALPFVKRLISRGHLTPLEHARVLVPIRDIPDCPGKALPRGYADRCVRDGFFVRMNVRDFIAIGGSIEKAARYTNSRDYMSVRFTCDRGIANELITHRVLSKNQESTRFCNYAKEVCFVLPDPFPSLGREASADEAKRDEVWQQACRAAACFYTQLLELGASPQEARNVLPLSLKTELIVTTTHALWEGVLALRLDGAAHPQMRYLMELLIKDPLFPHNKVLTTSHKVIK